MVDSLRSVLETAEAIPAAVRATWDDVSEAFAAGSVTTAEKRHLIGELEGHLQDVADVRADLDTVDAPDFILGTHPEQIVRTWQKERETRRQLVKMAGGIIALKAYTRRLEVGDVRTLYISRDGDTLQRIAAQHLGSWQDWHQILEANPELSAGPLPSGTAVIIPARR